MNKDFLTFGAPAIGEEEIAEVEAVCVPVGLSQWAVQVSFVDQNTVYAAYRNPPACLSLKHTLVVFVSTASHPYRFCTRLASILIFSFIPLKRAEHAHS